MSPYCWYFSKRCGFHPISDCLCDLAKNGVAAACPPYLSPLFEEFLSSSCYAIHRKKSPLKPKPGLNGPPVHKVRDVWGARPYIFGDRPGGRVENVRKVRNARKGDSFWNWQRLLRL